MRIDHYPNFPKDPTLPAEVVVFHEKHGHRVIGSHQLGEAIDKGWKLNHQVTAEGQKLAEAQAVRDTAAAAERAELARRDEADRIAAEQLAAEIEQAEIAAGIEAARKARVAAAIAKGVAEDEAKARAAADKNKNGTVSPAEAAAAGIKPGPVSQ